VKYDHDNKRIPKITSYFTQISWKITSTETLQNNVFGHNKGNYKEYLTTAENLHVNLWFYEFSKHFNENRFVHLEWLQLYGTF